MDFLKLTIITLVFTFTACSPQAEPEFIPVQFEVNPDALGSTYYPDQASFQFIYPQDVSKIDSAELESIQEMVGSDTNSYFEIELLDMHRSSKGFVVSISQIDSAETPAKIIDSQYSEELKTTFDTDSVTRAKIVVNGFYVIQFLIKSQDYINIKLYLLLEPNMIQVDYFIPSNHYSELLEQIESSIGSISHKNKEE